MTSKAVAVPKLGSIALVALFAALISAGTFISIPLPIAAGVPIVLQNMFALLAGLLLGPVRGGAAVMLYLLAGSLGLPVFTGASGGIAHFLSPSGGYLPGYFLSAVVAGLIAGNPAKKIPLWRMIAAVAAGFLIVYVPGCLCLGLQLKKGVLAAITAGFLPFIPGDVLKAIVCVLIAPRLRRAIALVL
jgi:biotin transport system substrate-specific component